MIGIDADPIELPKTEARLRALGFPPESVVVRRMNFAGLETLLAVDAPDGVDVLLADLGLSSMQIDDPARGFTFKADGPLDMRMNPSRGRPARALLSSLGESSLSQILLKNSDEPHHLEISRAILRANAQSPLSTTAVLAEVVREVAQKIGANTDETVRRVFQSIRIAVNDEFGALSALLRNLPSYVKSGGRVAVLSFHSGEDRLVKAAFKAGLREGVYSSSSNEVVRASPEAPRESSIVIGEIAVRGPRVMNTTQTLLEAIFSVSEKCQKILYASEHFRAHSRFLSNAVPESPCRYRRTFAVTFRQFASKSLLAAGILGSASAGFADSDLTKKPASPAARQRFAALLTAVKTSPRAKPGTATVASLKGSLRAFGGGPPGTTVRPCR